MSLLVNPNLSGFGESATLAINQTAIAKRRAGEKVFHFGFGQAPFPIPEIIQDALRNNADKSHYLPTRGLPELCEALADCYKRNYGLNFSEQNVCVGPGSKELLFQLLFITDCPLIIPAPSWVSYGPQAQLQGKKIVPIRRITS